MPTNPLMFLAIILGLAAFGAALAVWLDVGQRGERPHGHTGEGGWFADFFDGGDGDGG